MRGYVICSSPRSGTTLLCTLLRSSGVAGWPQSWFRLEDRAEYARDWGVSATDAADFARGMARAGRGATEVFALRLMWETLVEIGPWIGPGREGLEAALGPLRFVWLERRDKVAQAVSRHRAEASGIWHLGIEEDEKPRVPVYDFARIDQFRREGEADAAGWARWFAAEAVEPLRLAYEDLAADPAAEASRVLNWLGLPDRRLSAGTVKMAGAESADWAARYRREAGMG